MVLLTHLFIQETSMQKRFFLRAIACAAVAASATTAMAQDKFKIGLILPLSLIHI